MTPAPTDRRGRIAAGIDRLVRLSLYSGMGWVLAMMFLTTLDVAGRALFSRPITGTIELNRFMLAAFAIMGMAYTHRERANVRVTLLLKALSPRPRAALELLSQAISLGLVGLLAWQSAVMGMEEIDAGTTTDALGIPVYPLYFLLSAGSLGLCLEMLRQMASTAGACFPSAWWRGNAQER